MTDEIWPFDFHTGPDPTGLADNSDIMDTFESDSQLDTGANAYNSFSHLVTLDGSMMIPAGERSSDYGGRMGLGETHTPPVLGCFQPFGDQSTPQGDDPRRGLPGVLSQGTVNGIPEAGVSNLLETFYRLSTPTPIAHFSEQHLVQHFFHSVCPLFACYDSEFNLFRHIVKETWTRSRTVSLSIQSMAIAHLGNHYRYMAPLGHVKQTQAWQVLQSDLQSLSTKKVALDSVLVSLLLLGMSAPWHNPSNLGLQYLSIARNLVQSQLKDQQGMGRYLDVPRTNFFLGALMYWEMLASFVDPIPMMPFPGFGTPAPRKPAMRERYLPHPWAGISMELQFALAEIGRLLRRRRTPLGRGKQSAGAESEDDDEKWAYSLENFVLTLQLSGPDEILDYHDANTPKEDLISAADAQRAIALLEIYAAFPECLDSKIDEGWTLPPAHSRNFFPPADHSCFTERLESCLCAIAIHALEIVKEIEISSAACRMLPLIFVSCASHLRVPGQVQSGNDAHECRREEVIRGRSYVEAQMLSFARKYPQKQMLRMCDIIREVWQRLDLGVDRAHWMEVINEKGWQTMMG